MPEFQRTLKAIKPLKVTQPFYTKAHPHAHSIKAIAIDSPGLKCYGHDEWHAENYPKNSKKDRRKLHITVDQHHVIHSSELTDRLTQDVRMQPVMKAMNFTATGIF